MLVVLCHTGVCYALINALMETVQISTCLRVQTLIAVGVRTATHDFPGAHR